LDFKGSTFIVNLNIFVCNKTNNKHMNTKILSFVLLGSFLAFQGCKDDEGSTTPAAKTKTELLSASPWIVSSITANPGIPDGEGNLITDLFSMDEPCRKDDETVYTADGTGSSNEGASKCNPEDSQEYDTFTWTFNSEETEIMQDGDTLSIVALSEANMVLSTVLTEDGTSYTLTATFGH
jgi:hypothetical protein